MEATPISYIHRASLAAARKSAQPAPVALVSPQLPGAGPASNISGAQLRNALISRVKFGNAAMATPSQATQSSVWMAPGFSLEDGHSGKTHPGNRMPSIIQENDNGFLAVDPISLNFANNIIEFTETFNQETARSFNAQVDYLKNKILDARDAKQKALVGGGKAAASADEKDDKKEAKEAKDETVRIYINSPGGMIISLYAMLDAVESLKKHNIPVATYCRGMAASCGSLLFALGTPGQRFMTPNGQVLVHQPLGGSQGQATEMDIENQSIQEMKVQLTNMLAKAAIDGKVFRLEKQIQGLGDTPHAADVLDKHEEIGRLHNEKKRIEKTESVWVQAKLMRTESEFLRAQNRELEAEDLLDSARTLIRRTKAELKQEAKEEEHGRLTSLIGRMEDSPERARKQKELNSLESRNIPYSNNRERLAQVMERDRWLSAEEAVEYGLADGIVTH